MNKIIAIVLAILTCVCAISCVVCVTTTVAGNANSAAGDEALIGRWDFERMNVFMTFNVDNTGRMGSIDNEEDGADFRWSYDAEADVYAIYMDGKAYVYYGKLDTNGNWVYNGETATKK